MVLWIHRHTENSTCVLGNPGSTAVTSKGVQHLVRKHDPRRKYDRQWLERAPARCHRLITLERAVDSCEKLRKDAGGQ
jgi:hypothetical protein